MSTADYLNEDYQTSFTHERQAPTTPMPTERTSQTVQAEVEPTKNGDKMVDEGCPNLPPIPAINIDECAPIVQPTPPGMVYGIAEAPVTERVDPFQTKGSLLDDPKHLPDYIVHSMIGKPGECKSVLTQAVEAALLTCHDAVEISIPTKDLDKYMPEIIARKGEIVGKKDVKHFSLMEIRPFLKSIDARLTRRRYSETTLREYLTQIQPAGLAEQYLEFYDAFPFHKEVCAGAKHHHWWKGGLEDHLREMIGIGLDIMDLYPGDFNFSKSDLIIAVFLHDFGKVWTYRFITAEDRAKNPKKFKEQQVFTYTDGQFNILDAESKILLELGRHGITPTDEQWSAVIFAEGGFSAAMYDFGGRSETGNTVFSKNHLATFVSVLDQWSAQILGRSII